ncbi:MarR family winged helix-turn-helix transcriptional regulator [Microbacterium sp.]|uniref:MarR family winged helix-turn-helix transcriptional regulator n=1 Tax=Microbacterium sp. TaxID=51671 RepID=UPI003A8D99CB
MAEQPGVSEESDSALVELQGHLNLLFARARTHWREAAARIDPQLQPAGYKLLMFIVRVGSANAHELAERFEMDKSVISRQVRMLEDLGLLESRPDELDGRQRVLTPTSEACTALAELRDDHTEKLRSTLAELTPEEMQGAFKVFRLLAEN